MNGRNQFGYRLFTCIEEMRKTGTAIRIADLVPILLSPMMSGTLATRERIIKSLKLLREEAMNPLEAQKMEAVLYALANKFLKREDLQDVKEMIAMTVLGQMLRDDGIQEGIRVGVEAFILDNLEEGMAKEQIIGKLRKRFKLDEDSAMKYYEEFAK